MGDGGRTLYIGILVDFAIDEMTLCRLGVLNDVIVAGVMVGMYRWLSMLKPGKEMITADDDSGTPRAPPIGLCRSRPMPSTESRLADCTF